MMPHNQTSELYDAEFYTQQIMGSERSARVVVPLLLSIVSDVDSVIDVGCGAGTWLARFKYEGVQRVLGIDGGSAQEAGQLAIDPAEFKKVNLDRPIRLQERFGLCVSLEVAEHLHPDLGAQFVESLCHLSDVVAFSAAVPGQGGTHHVNERWASYWISLFGRHGYAALDLVRPRIWYDERVEWWYRQNIILFANAAGRARVAIPESQGLSMPPDCVHPSCFETFRGALERELTMRSEWTAISAPQVVVTSSTQGNAEELCSALESALEEVRQERDELSIKEAEQRMDATKARQECDALALQLRSVVESSSWKATYPIRVLLDDRPAVARRLRSSAAIIWHSMRAARRRR
jgi:SAM-dependent methyltransferase